MGKFVKTQAEGHILTVTLDRPEVLNALHALACHELAAIWDDFAANDDLWVAIITGAGKAFCAGHDLVDGFFDAMPESGWAGLARREGLNKPLICAIHGYAFGGGWEIAMACDIVIADSTAVFALPEPRVGFAALGGGANRLVRRMPWHVAMGLLLTGNRINAETAHRWGAVTEVAPAGTALAVARRYAEDILTCAPQAVRATKEAARATVEPDAAERDLYALSLRLAAHLTTLQDTREGLDAFAQKRPPVWTGR